MLSFYKFCNADMYFTFSESFTSCDIYCSFAVDYINKVYFFVTQPFPPVMNYIKDFLVTKFSNLEICISNKIVL